MDRLLNVLTILSGMLLALVLYSVRRAHIRVEYSVSWLGAAVALFLLSRSHRFLEWLSGYLGLSDPPVALILLIFAVFLGVFYRFSVVISALKDANIALAQRVAILEFELRHLHESR